MHQIYIRRTLSEIEAYILQELFEMCHTIMYSGYSDPQELGDRIQSLADSIKAESEVPALSTAVVHR